MCHYMGSGFVCTIWVLTINFIMSIIVVGVESGYGLHLVGFECCVVGVGWF